MKRALAAALFALVATTAHEGRSDPPTAGAGDSPDARACIRAYELGQELRVAGKLRAARDQLIVCVKDTCPTVARQDCATWLDQVESSLPSLAVSVVDAKGAPALYAAVTLDGALLPEWASGRAISVDPGNHEVRAKGRGGEAAIETVLVVEGHRNQPVVLRLGPRDPGAVRSPAARRDDGSSSVAPWVFGGVAVLGFGGFAGAGIAAIVRESDLDDGCRPDCSSGEIGQVRTLRVVSGVSLGVGVAGAIGAVLSVLLADPASPRAQTRSTARGVAPWFDASSAGLRARF